ncbi:phosphate ABC transporter ATP-binding protein [Candidatus Chloroploca asiatica]|uniref:Phosphate ABC transporter ATP-binding protein n=1 Tax=Candidatus Chloroploca asiatica TaxID=1506545 RepID=A0A2H3KGY5_9CHLR|nr:phosphate ABC transporter ATP-binding protein [Candidatus Chloroploca asiatica]PDV97003.1 phosphate ABC transporter ATP-binding protein [Candidatus Chloroploca asiatica]
MNTESIYQLEAIQQRYGERLVLDIPSLQIERGELLALVGPSGAGKSTLLRILNFLETPTQGQLRFAGHTLGSRVPLELQRRVTTVFQRPALLSGSVLDNVAYGLRLRRHPQVRERAREALAAVGLGHLARAAAHTLSGGEAQRVALARALVITPDVLLLDEPTANLDPANVAAIERTVAEAHRRGTTIMLVTHNIFQARRLAQRVALMLDGRIIELAPTETFFETPHDPRTTAFIKGDMLY